MEGTVDLRMAAGANRDECESFLRDNVGLLYRVAASYEADSSRREDLLQDMGLAIWQAAGRFEGRSSFKTFALRVAHNRGLTHGAKEARRRDTVALEEHHGEPLPSAEESVQQALRQEQLLGAVRRLPLAQRQLVSLALEGLSYNEIAEVLGITANNVGVRLNRARKRLQEVLGG